MKDVRKKAGGRRSVLGYLVPPYLINYNPPWKMGVWQQGCSGCGLEWAGVGQRCSAQLVSSEDPMGGHVDQGDIQQPLAGVTQAPWDFTLWRWPPRRRPPLLGLG